MSGEKQSLTLTQSAAHTLAQCLSSHEQATPRDKIARYAKAWQHVRKAYVRTVADHDLDDGQLLPKAKDTDASWRERREAYETALKAWAEVEVQVPLSNRHLECCRDSVKWHAENRDKAAVKLPNTHHVAQLLVALGLADAEADD